MTGQRVTSSPPSSKSHVSPDMQTCTVGGSGCGITAQAMCCAGYSVLGRPNIGARATGDTGWWAPCNSHRQPGAFTWNGGCSCDVMESGRGPMGKMIEARSVRSVESPQR